MHNIFTYYYIINMQNVAEKLEALKTKKNEAQKEIRVLREEADANVQRQSKAQWAICLCNRTVRTSQSNPMGFFCCCFIQKLCNLLCLKVHTYIYIYILV